MLGDRGIRSRLGVFYGYGVLLISVILHALGAGEFFYESGDRRRGVLKVVRGLALVMIVLFGLSPFFSLEIYWMRAIRYSRA